MEGRNQQIEAEAEVVQTGCKGFSEDSGAGCSVRLYSLRPWRFASPDKVER